MKDNKEAEKYRNEGNGLYNQAKLYEALISYNKSLCHAVPQSRHLSLAYANRSAVYLVLKEYDKCLENIQLARDHGYQPEEKLKQREENCLEAMNNHRVDSENDPSQFFKLSYPPNKKIPFIANCLELKENEQFGRHIITNKDLLPGDVVGIEEAFLKLIDKSSIYVRCSNCLRSNMLSLIPCTGQCSFGNLRLIFKKKARHCKLNQTLFQQCSVTRSA
jgi:tetratricopeptide (TPR) repeat protein